MVNKRDKIMYLEYLEDSTPPAPNNTRGMATHDGHVIL
jgi:hypothetical protein